MTRRDFVGIATAGPGATVGGVATSLVTRAIDKAASEAAQQVGATDSGSQTALPADNVGTSDAKPSSVADATAAHPDRIMVGTDKVGHWKTYPAEVVKYYSLLDKLKPETAKKVCSENILGLVKRYDS